MENLTFHNPEYIIFALVIPVYILAASLSEYLSWRKLRHFAVPKLLARLVAKPAETHKLLRVLTMVFVLLATTIMLMQPRWGEYRIQTLEYNVDIVFVLDISRSMLARDSYPSRLGKAKTELSELLNQLNGERAGIVLFAGSAFSYAPLTHDYQTLNAFVYNINADMLSHQGTAIVNALETALQLLATGKPSYKKVIVLISDGEFHDTSLAAIVKTINDARTSIYALGIGSEEGDWVPRLSALTGRLQSTEPGNAVAPHYEYLRDQQGKIVVSKLNKRTLTELSFLTGGKLSIPAQQELGGGILYQHIRKLGTHSSTGTTILTQADKFQYLALIILLLLLGDFILTRLPHQK